MTFSGPQRRRRLAACLAVTAAVAVAVFMPDRPSFLRSTARFHDFLHVPGLAAVTALLLVAWPLPHDASRSRQLIRLAVVFAAAVGIGVLVELLQAAIGRRVSVGDIARDAGGAGAAVLVAASFHARRRPASRWALRLAALALAAAFAPPTVKALIDERRASRQFPILAAFTHPDELGRFEWSGATPGPLARDRVLPLTFWPGRYPGFVLRYFPHDWRGFRRLVVTATNPDPRPLSLVVRIDDERHNQEYTDRYNGRFMMGPGRDEIRVSLEAVETAPRGRTLDLSRVSEVVIFSPGLREPRVLRLESIRLER